MSLGVIEGLLSPLVLQLPPQQFEYLMCVTNDVINAIALVVSAVTIIMSTILFINQIKKINQKKLGQNLFK